MSARKKSKPQKKVSRPKRSSGRAARSIRGGSKSAKKGAASKGRSGGKSSERAKAKARPSKKTPARKDKTREKQRLLKAKEQEKRAKEKEREKQQLLKQKAQEKELAAKEKEKARLLKKKESEQLLKQKEKERLLKEKEKEQLLKQKEKERLLKEKEKEQLLKQKEKERLLKEKEKEQLLKQKEKERLLKEKEKEQLLKQKEKERLLKEKEKAAEREAARQAKEDEREQQRLAREAEREELRRQKEAEREELRRQKEAERARRDAERETYRKAKEAEREQLRAEKEAARRALEGKVARANKRAQRADGLGRGGGSTRVYRPDAIPDQSGTTRRAMEQVRFVGVRHQTPGPASAPGSGPLTPSSGPPSASAGEGRPTPPPPPTLSVEERWARINQRLEATDISFQREYRESFDMSWIYHDSALEGVVYTFQELKTAVDPSITVVPDSSLQPVCEEIRRSRQAVELVRELAEKRRVPLNVDIIKKIYVTLHPEEGDVKTVKYRKDIPQHRLYFHEYAPPDKIAYKVRQVVDWLNGPEPKKIKNALRVAARVHFDLLRAFPFQSDSGKVSRLLMNVILMRAGYPPAIIHSTERQKYYEALKGQLPVIISMMNDAINNALLSIEKRLEEVEARRPGAAPTAGTPATGAALPGVTTAPATRAALPLSASPESEDADTGVEPELQPESESEPESAAELDSEADSAPESGAEGESESEVEGESEAEPETETDADSESEEDSDADSETPPAPAIQ
jgi:Fic family protein